MSDELKEIPEKLEKYGLAGGIGLLLTIMALLANFPISSIPDLKSLNTKQLFIVTLSVVGLILIAYALLKKNKTQGSTVIKLVDDKYDYPDKIDTAVISQIYHRHFYKEKIEFLLTVDEIESDEIVMTSEMTYYVVNRTKERHTWQMEYKYKKQNAIVKELKIDDKKLPFSPDISFGRGIRVPHEMVAGQRSKVSITVTERFRRTDFALFTSYNPATDLTLTIENVFPEIHFDFEIFYFSNVVPVRSGTRTTVQFKDGILPYQGVRLNWEPQNN